MSAPEWGQQQELLSFSFWIGAVPLLPCPSECHDTQLDRGSAGVSVGDLTDSASELFSPKVIPCLAFIYW